MSPPVASRWEDHSEYMPRAFDSSIDNGHTERGLLLLSHLAMIEERPSDDLQHLPSSSSFSMSSNSQHLLKNWFVQPSRPDSNIMWLSGLSDSFDLRDINAVCKGHCFLAGRFSFTSRKGSEQAFQIVPTLAHQIAVNLPSLRPFIGRAVALDPEIFSMPFGSQMETILFGPIRECISLQGDAALRSFVLIDGLEFYHSLSTQKQILSAIEMVATTSNIPLRFLFTSRKVSKDHRLPFQPGTHLRISNHANISVSQDSALPSWLKAPGNTKTPFDSGFPELVRVESYSASPAESYTRSFMMLGHSIPLWQPTGDLGSPIEYLHRGPEIGDIMYIDEHGVFVFFFNIFRARDDPLNRRVMAHGGHYEPLTLDVSEIIRVDDYFPPGTIITSEGITTTMKHENPFTVNFKANCNEGAVLVLPEGASREDIISTTRFHKYVQRWAPYWYKTLLPPNGSIFLVTGSDKASDFACATFFVSHPDDLTVREIDMDYLRRVKGENPWKRTGRADGNYYKLPDTGPASKLAWPTEVRCHCVFIRGMRIALCNAAWSSHNIRLVGGQTASAHTNVLCKAPFLDHIAELLLVSLHARRPELLALGNAPKENHQFFHPIFVVGPDLLQKHPNASVVLLNDSDWSMLTNKGHGDWTHIKALIDELYLHFTVVVEDGVIFFSKKAGNIQEHVRSNRTVAVPRLPRRDSVSIKMISMSKFDHYIDKQKSKLPQESF